MKTLAASDAPAPGEPASSEVMFTPVVTAASMGIVACHYCGTCWEDLPEVNDDQVTECARCGAALRHGKPHSVAYTWALLIAAYIMYIPANLLPVMVSSKLWTSQEDTIMSGIIYLWITGERFLAGIVFVASVLVPLVKLLVLTLLTATAQLGVVWRPRQRTRLYRLIETVGRWSMLDVFVVALLAALVQIQSLANVTPGPAVTPFGILVVLTMLATLSFDPRLIWEARTVHSADVDDEDEDPEEGQDDDD